MSSYSLMKFIFKNVKKYAGGESFGADEAGNVYKGMITFMIVGLTKRIPFVLHAAPVIHAALIPIGSWRRFWGVLIAYNRQHIMSEPVLVIIIPVMLLCNKNFYWNMPWTVMMIYVSTSMVSPYTCSMILSASPDTICRTGKDLYFLHFHAIVWKTWD